MNVRERTIATGLILAVIGSLGFMVAYWQRQSIQWEGAALTAAFTGFLIAALGWSKWIVPYEQVVDIREWGVDHTPADYREEMASTDDKRAQDDAYAEGIAQVTRKRWLNRLLYVAAGFLGLAALFPIGSLGPKPDDELFHTRWKRGDRLQRVDGSLVRAGDLDEDSAVTVFPEGNVGDAQSTAILVRLPAGTVNDAAHGYICYSKVCTHAGCPVALYRSRDHLLVCPCHQSVFDCTSNGAVQFGPADRPLPRLPIEVGADGYLTAKGDFPEPVGPGFWERA